jgi:DNA-binding NarL/FixJ family response regulator
MLTAPEHPPLVGRAEEERLLAQAVASAAAGEPAVVALFGEAGIGKSALLRVLGERAAAGGLRVLDGRAAEHERDVPFALAVDVLDDAADAIGPSRFASLGAERQAELSAVLPSVQTPEGVAVPAVGPEERFRLHRALRALIELLAREQPVALILDDVHWADGASLELLLHLLRRPPRAPHLLAFALRPVDPAPRLRDALRTAAAATTQLDLRPLARDAALELVAAIPNPAQRERIAEEAGGSPLFLHELARVGAWEGPLPPTILAAVRLEIEALPPGTRTLLDGAAVAGDPFDPELAAAAAGLEADWLVSLDHLVAADLVRPGDGPRAFLFRHPLVRRAVYDATPPAWRLGAHQRVASVLEARGAAAVTRAYHVERCAAAGDRGAVAVLSEAAAATMASSPSTAARWYRAAVELLPDDAPPEERGALLAPLATALGTAGRIGEAGAVLDEVLALLPPDPSPLRSMLVAAAGALENLEGRYATSRRRLLAELERLPEDVDPAWRVALEVEVGIAYAFEQDGEQTRHWGLRAAQAAGPTGTLAAFAQALVAIGSVWTGRREEAGPALEAAAAALEAADEHEFAVRPEPWFYLAFALVFDERYDELIETCRRGIAATLRVGQARVVGALRGMEAMGQIAKGDYNASAELVDAAEEAARLQGSDNSLQFALWLKAGSAHDRGDALERRRAVAELEEIFGRMPASTSTRTGRANVAGLLADEDPERCVREMLAAAGPRLEGVEPTWLTATAETLCRALTALGRVEEADRYATLAEEHAARLRLPITAERARLARAHVLLAQGDADGAAALALEAADATERRGVLRETFLGRLLGGQALAAAGRTEEAVDVLRALADETGRRGANRLRDAAARELRRLGVRARGSSATPGAGEELTERERAIAEMVAGGSTNKQVGAALFLSEKTVEHHLSRVYAKLGVKSRVELASVWREEG